MKRRRLLAAILCAAMALTLLPAAALAEEAQPSIPPYEYNTAELLLGDDFEGADIIVVNQVILLEPNTKGGTLTMWGKDFQSLARAAELIASGKYIGAEKDNFGDWSRALNGVSRSGDSTGGALVSESDAGRLTGEQEELVNEIMQYMTGAAIISLMFKQEYQTWTSTEQFTDQYKELLKSFIATFDKLQEILDSLAESIEFKEGGVLDGLRKALSDPLSSSALPSDVTEKLRKIASAFNSSNREQSFQNLTDDIAAANMAAQLKNRNKYLAIDRCGNLLSLSADGVSPISISQSYADFLNDDGNKSAAIDFEGFGDDGTRIGKQAFQISALESIPIADDTGDAAPAVLVVEGIYNGGFTLGSQSIKESDFIDGEADCTVPKTSGEKPLQEVQLTVHTPNGANTVEGVLYHGVTGAHTATGTATDDLKTLWRLVWKHGVGSVDLSNGFSEIEVFVDAEDGEPTYTVTNELPTVTPGKPIPGGGGGAIDAAPITAGGVVGEKNAPLMGAALSVAQQIGQDGAPAGSIPSEGETDE